MTKQSVREELNKFKYDCICDKDNLPVGIDCACGALDNNLQIDQMNKELE